MRYFLQFPIIEYRDALVRDITKRVGIYSDINRAPTLYYDYNIPEGQTIYGLANDYYGDSYYYWVIMLTNSLTDPYKGWPMTTDVLNANLIRAYGSFDMAQETVLFYRNEHGDRISPQSFVLNPQIGFDPVDAVQDATEQNESLRAIRLLDRNYINQFETEFLSLIGP